LWLVPEEPGLADVIGEQRELLSRLRAVVEAKDAENQVLRAELDAARERERRLGLRLAELERGLRMDSTDSGTPTSKEAIGARERRRAERQESERERRKDRHRGGQPGHPGRGLARDPGERKDADPATRVSRASGPLRRRHASPASISIAVRRGRRITGAGHEYAEHGETGPVPGVVVRFHRALAVP
jgi:hypothetical protein